jgi:xanthine dehydrogenase accessory factor
VPRLLILGGGLDAIPLVNMASELGWRVTVADHRPAYLERDAFGSAELTVLVDPTDIERRIAIDIYDAVIVMSHHLVTDERYLRQLAGHSNAYLGVLGPPARRQRILDNLASEDPALSGRLRGPVGLDIGADSPESIALSILAEIQQVLSRRSAAGAAGLQAVSARS